MNPFISTICAAALTLTGIGSGQANAAAVAPRAVAGSVLQTSVPEGLVEVQQRRYYPYVRGDNRRKGYRFDDRRGWQQPQPRWPSRKKDSGPDLGSAIVGAIIGGILVDQLHQPSRTQTAPRYDGAYLNSNHIDWCHNRWRSFRASDNSYQPYNGPRRICVSPYGPS
jgi:hypothetical protein